ncbi:ImmA/IrrE family metallo-endopeptidase [Solirubrobacter taibaiensis]|nr:ImmA/IrrE family metallo-endopeptidase [Solirubrobacter taibaiensis]
MRDVEERAEAVLAQLPTYVWDQDTLPVPVEDIADTQFGLLVRDVEDMASAPGAPLVEHHALSGLLLPARGEIWVNAHEAKQWPPRRRFTIGHELGHWVMHRAAGQQALFCRVNEAEAKARDIEEEASAFAAALLMPQWLFVREHARAQGDVATLCRTFGSSIAATQRRIASLF